MTKPFVYKMFRRRLTSLALVMWCAAPALVLAAVAVSPGPSVAHARHSATAPPTADGRATVEDDALTAEVRVGQTSDTNGSVSCRWTQFTGVDPVTGRFTEDAVRRTRNKKSEVLYERLCGTSRTLHWIAEDVPKRVLHVAEDRASDLIPRLLMQTAPPIDKQVVTVGTWFWVPRPIWKPITVVASVPTSVGPIVVAVTATPTHLIYSPGDGGDSTICEGPGRPWMPHLGDRATTDCMHTYSRPSHVREKGTFPARMSVQWRVTWKSNLGLSGRLPNTRLGIGRTARVLELQALTR
jgi:hypothetical protein